MRNVRVFFALSSALIVAASVFGVSADAQKSDFDQCTVGLDKAECACELALEKGTQKALRDYLKLYRNADTACNAQASTAIFENSNGGEIGSSNGGSSNGGSSNGGSSNGGGSNGGLNNGHGNGDQDAPGNSGDHNNAENSEHSGQGNSAGN